MKLSDLTAGESRVAISGDRGDEYIITFTHGRPTYCTCPGWQSSRSDPKACKHIKRMVLTRGMEEVFLSLEQRGFVSFQSNGAEEAVVKALVDKVKEVYGV